MAAEHQTVTSYEGVHVRHVMRMKLHESWGELLVFDVWRMFCMLGASAARPEIGRNTQIA